MTQDIAGSIVRDTEDKNENKQNCQRKKDKNKEKITDTKGKGDPLSALGACF